MTHAFEMNLSLPDGIAGNDFESQDPALHVLLDTIVFRYPDNSVSLTILSNGQLVSGQVISMQRWTERMIEQLRENLAEEHQAPIGRPLAEALDDLDMQAEELAEQRQDGDLAIPTPNFIHMRDVTIGHGSDSETITLPLWRGRVESIDGWSLGSR